jgi:nucleotide-binding universal stress UspA family protein
MLFVRRPVIHSRPVVFFTMTRNSSFRINIIGDDMFPEIKKILYTTDLSENARYAFGYAASLAVRYTATVTVLHVLENLSPPAFLLVSEILGEERWAKLKKQNSDQVIASIRRRIETFCDEQSCVLSDGESMVDQVIVKPGHPVDEIVVYAEKGGFDLVVMGSRGQGQGASRESALGSTSRKVLKRCRKPVLVVRLQEKG